MQSLRSNANQLTELNNSSIHKTSGKIYFILLELEEKQRKLNYTAGFKTSKSSLTLASYVGVWSQ